MRDARVGFCARNAFLVMLVLTIVVSACSSKSKAKAKQKPETITSTAEPATQTPTPPPTPAPTAQAPTEESDDDEEPPPYSKGDKVIVNAGGTAMSGEVTSASAQGVTVKLADGETSVPIKDVIGFQPEAKLLTPCEGGLTRIIDSTPDGDCAQACPTGSCPAGFACQSHVTLTDQATAGPPANVCIAEQKTRPPVAECAAGEIRIRGPKHPPAGVCAAKCDPSGNCSVGFTCQGWSSLTDDGTRGPVAKVCMPLSLTSCPEPQRRYVGSNPAGVCATPCWKDFTCSYDSVCRSARFLNDDRSTPNGNFCQKKVVKAGLVMCPNSARRYYNGTASGACGSICSSCNTAGYSCQNKTEVRDDGSYGAVIPVCAPRPTPTLVNCQNFDGMDTARKWYVRVAEGPSGRCQRACFGNADCENPRQKCVKKATLTGYDANGARRLGPAEGVCETFSTPAPAPAPTPAKPGCTCSLGKTFLPSGLQCTETAQCRNSQYYCNTKTRQCTCKC